MKLKVFEEAGCGSHPLALNVAQEIACRFPCLESEVNDLSEASAVARENVFAVTICLLNDSVTSSGNPTVYLLAGLLGAAGAAGDMLRK